MNREIRDEWVKRLRSGEYAQGDGRLRFLDDKYCCLGVLCDIGVDKGVIPAPTPAADGYIYDGLAATLPRPISGWSGVPQWGSYPDGSLINDNDSGCTFDEIANIIEANF